MSTIALPPLRKAWTNLLRYTLGGDTQSSATNPTHPGGTFIGTLSQLGLAIGDVVSGSGEVLNAVSGENSRFEISARNDAAGILATVDSGYANNTAFTRRSAAGLVLPVGTTRVYCSVRRQTGTGSMSIRNAILNRGSSVAAYRPPSRDATAPLAQVAFGMDGSQIALPTNAGVTQITSFPSRLWMLRFSTIPFETTSDEFREWELAVNQLSDLANVFRFVPPDYRGPSTGYAGANPAVNGGSQLGLSLVCDGVDASTPIVKAGDFASFDVTSPLGNTNAQLFKIAADATSNGSGQVTLTLTKPIRQAPADNAVVQIFSPTTQFRFTQPRHETASDSDDFAGFSVDAIEQVYP